MKAKRLWWTVRTALIRGSHQRAEYARKAQIYAYIGNNVSIQSRRIPLYSELISFHNNIVIARNVDFCTHDIIHVVFNRMSAGGIKLPATRSCLNRSAIHLASFLSVFFPRIALTYLGWARTIEQSCSRML